MHFDTSTCKSGTNRTVQVAELQGQFVGLTGVKVNFPIKEKPGNVHMQLTLVVTESGINSIKLHSARGHATSCPVVK